MWNILLPPNAHVAFPSTKQVFISSFKTWFLFLTIKKSSSPFLSPPEDRFLNEKRSEVKRYENFTRTNLSITRNQREKERKERNYFVQTEFPSLEEKFDRTVWKKKESAKFLSKERYRWISRIGMKERGILFWLGNWCCFHGWSGD